jgi:hypothetical protein
MKDDRDYFIEGLEAGLGASGAPSKHGKLALFIVLLPFFLLFTVGQQVYDIWWSVFPR